MFVSFSATRGTRRPHGRRPSRLLTYGDEPRRWLRVVRGRPARSNFTAAELPAGHPRSNRNWTPVRSLVERLLLGGVGRDHVEAWVSDELVHQWRVATDPGPVRIDVEDEAPGMIG